MELALELARLYGDYSEVFKLLEQELAAAEK
jgi:hypothetical protein